MRSGQTACQSAPSGYLSQPLGGSPTSDSRPRRRSGNCDASCHSETSPGSRPWTAAAALERLAAERDRLGWGRALNLLGAIHFERGAIKRADTCFGQALRLARESEDALLTACASKNLGAVADLRGRSDLALSVYRAALLAYQGLGHRRGIAETCHNLGVTLARLGALEDARQSSQRAVAEAEALGVIDEEVVH